MGGRAPLDPYPSASEEVTVRAGHQVLMVVDDNSVLFVGKPQWILGQQLRGQFDEQKVEFSCCFECDQIYNNH